MSMQERILLVIFAANGVLAVLYLLWGVLIRPWVGKKETYAGRVKYSILFLVMLLCPGIGLLFFLLGQLLFRYVFHQKVELSDVTFSKERKQENTKEDIAEKLNIAPIEDAIAVSDKNHLRSLMMNVIKGDVQKSLSAISLALESEDSEASHYAASVLSEELDVFRKTVQSVYEKIGEKDEKQAEYCIYLIEYMHGVLVQKVFIPMEQTQYVHLLAEVGEILFQQSGGTMQSEFLEWIFMHLLAIRDFTLADMWSQRLVQTYPYMLAAYTCRLKLYFHLNRHEDFFRTMEELKHSDIAIDNETLELIRMFG